MQIDHGRENGVTSGKYRDKICLGPLNRPVYHRQEMMSKDHQQKARIIAILAILGVGLLFILASLLLWALLALRAGRLVLQPTPTPTETPTPQPTPGLSEYWETLPTFFPPKATDTVELHIIPDLLNLTLQKASDEISSAMADAGYEQRSYFWLDKDHRPGFAIITHIEQIQADGVPVRAGRWSFDLPSYGPFSIQTFLKALTSADPGNYRLIALVLSKVPFEEKKEPITPEQVEALDRGPKFLARTTDSDVIVTTDYHCIAYIYEFERKTRSDAPVFKETSDVSATDHLKSTGLFTNLTKVAQYR